MAAVVSLDSHQLHRITEGPQSLPGKKFIEMSLATIETTPIVQSTSLLLIYILSLLTISALPINSYWGIAGKNLHSCKVLFIDLVRSFTQIEGIVKILIFNSSSKHVATRFSIVQIWQRSMSTNTGP